MKKIFVYCKLPSKEIKMLKKNFQVKLHDPDKKELTLTEFYEKASGYNGILLQGHTIDKKFLKSNNKNLEAISNVAVGYDNIDLEEATRNKVAVFNTPNILNNAVADLSLGILIAVARRICEGDSYVRKGMWKKNYWNLMWGEDLNGESLGIIGLGNIGKEIAKRANSFGLKVFYNNRKKLSKKIEEELKVKYLKLNDLLTSCKFILLMLPLNNESLHMFDKRAFVKMRKDSFIINVARGKIINEKDLVDALLTKKIAGAALDVFEFEPKINKELLKLKNVVLMPHAGSATHKTRLNMMKLACENLKNFLIEGNSKNLVNKEIL